MKKSLLISLVAVFASLNIVCDSLTSFPEFSSGIWVSWIFIVEPINGIVLGPYAGFLSCLIGVMLGHCIYFRGDIYEFLFTFGAPIGAMISGFLFRGRWKMVLIYYTVLLGVYFITPITWQLPIWGIWDVYLAYAILVAASIVILKKGSWTHSPKGLPFILAVCALVGLEADILFRIFALIPCQTYRIVYEWDISTLTALWVLGAVETPVRVAISIIVTTTVGPSLVKVIEKIGILKEKSILHV